MLYHGSLPPECHPLYVLEIAMWQKSLAQIEQPQSFECYGQLAYSERTRSQTNIRSQLQPLA